MINKRSISKIAKKILRRQKGLRDHNIIHPQRDWAAGLLGGFLLLALGGAWSVLTYQEVSNRSVENADTEEIQQTIYRDQTVNDALAELKERKANYKKMVEAYQASAPVIEEEIAETEEIEEPEVTEVPVVLEPEETEEIEEDETPEPVLEEES